MYSGWQSNKSQKKANRAYALQQNQIADMQIAGLQQQMGMMPGPPDMSGAAAQARAIGEANAKRIRKEGDRTIKQRKKSNAQTEGSARARMAASGMKISSGSFKKYGDELKKEGKDEVKWIDKTVKSNMARARADANFSADMAMASMGPGPEGAIAGMEAEIANINAMRGMSSYGGGGGNKWGGLLNFGSAMGGWMGKFGGGRTSSGGGQGFAGFQGPHR